MRSMTVHRALGTVAAAMLFGLLFTPAASAQVVRAQVGVDGMT